MLLLDITDYEREQSMYQGMAGVAFILLMVIGYFAFAAWEKMKNHDWWWWLPPPSENHKKYLMGLGGAWADKQKKEKEEKEEEEKGFSFYTPGVIDFFLKKVEKIKEAYNITNIEHYTKEKEYSYIFCFNVDRWDNMRVSIKIWNIHYNRNSILKESYWIEASASADGYAGRILVEDHMHWPVVHWGAIVKGLFDKIFYENSRRIKYVQKYVNLKPGEEAT